MGSRSKKEPGLSSCSMGEAQGWGVLGGGADVVVDCVPQTPNDSGFRKERFPSQLASLVAQVVKRLPAVQETRVQSLGQEDPLEKAMATHSSILAWKIPWTEELGWLLSMGSQRVGYD